uniref:Thioredoxin domain-containing protein n=1 Tax=Chromera velia CCMP2878 TaxID=1169474 RepID=A0A0K6S7V7_9ALVE|eukprot:Cvel_649.t2-p1 / transcript=Cvel_649.t2 / gene=Cvel_649 / organism=Chromera_velia_CCMP2878 / gene_product=Thioredoxin H-type 2, putative / transcript_product=Thioredoxin H-type 2, putative / location=Cvel_scaffold20:6925-14538(+) / protein_length=652 / sequence_SO=supercontig / SO=protein_coding / is_pseudo=false
MMSTDLILFNTQLGLKVVQYDGGEEAPQYSVDNCLKAETHCSDDGTNYNLLLKTDEPALLTHVFIRGPENCTCPIKTALLWASKEPIDFASFSSSFDDFDKKKFDALPADAPNKPLDCLTTDETYNECVLELETPVEAQYFLFKLTEAWGEGNIDVGAIALAGRKAGGDAAKVGIEPLKKLALDEDIALFAWRHTGTVYEIDSSKDGKIVNAFLSNGGLFIVSCKEDQDNGRKAAFDARSLEGLAALGMSIFNCEAELEGFVNAVGPASDRTTTSLLFCTSGIQKKFVATSLPSSVEEVVAFAKAANEGTATKFIKSQTRPPNDADPAHPGITVVTAKSFDELVLDPKMNSFLDVWAEWCGPCKAVGPTIEALGKLMKDVPNVRICKFDCDANETDKTRLPEPGIPNLKIFPASESDKGTGIRYQGDRSLASFVSFIHKNMTGEKFDLAAKTEEATKTQQRLGALMKLKRMAVLLSRKLEIFEEDIPSGLSEVAELASKLKTMMEAPDEIEMQPSEMEELISLAVEKATEANLDELAKKKMNRLVIDISDSASFEDLKKRAQDEKKLLVIDFWAAWCGPCLAFAPQFGLMSEEMKGAALFAKVNVDDQRGLSQKFEIKCMPTFAIVKDGAEVGRLEGADKSGLEALIAEHSY